MNNGRQESRRSWAELAAAPCGLLLLLCTASGCATTPPQRELTTTLPEREVELTVPLTERCGGNNGVGCYLRGLSQAKEATTAEERSEAVSLIGEACAAKITEACETVAKHMKMPRRIAGRFPRYTDEALKLGLKAKLSVKCIIGETGLPRDCKILTALTEQETRLLAQSKMEKELIAAFHTWRFTPSLFDDQPFEFDYVFKVQLIPLGR